MTRGVNGRFRTPPVVGDRVHWRCHHLLIADVAMTHVPQQIDKLLAEAAQEREKRDKAIDRLGDLASLLCRLVGYERESEFGRMLASCCYSGNDFNATIRKIMCRRKPDSARRELTKKGLL